MQKGGKRKKKKKVTFRAPLSRAKNTFKNWLLTKNPQFFSNPHETLGKLLPHEVIIFTKCHEYWIKIVDFLLMANV